MPNLHSLSLVILTPALISTVGLLSAQAQSVVAALDGTETIVDQQGTQFKIERGSLSADGANQFHSFESFSLGAEEQANFVAPAEVQNIVAKVSSLAPSTIDGQLQVSANGGTPDLYLMNPAGVLFGPNVSLNLPAGLTVTTADGVGFEAGWFGEAIVGGSEGLNGAPTGEWVFVSGDSGAIANQGNLSLAPNADLSLISGSVINTGTLSSPGGNITLAAVPGESVVRLSQQNSLLTLELSTPDDTLSLSNLPELLAHSDQAHAVELVTSVDGSASLVGAATDDVLVSGALSVESTTDLGATDLGGNIALVGDRITLQNATLSASGLTGGGDIRVGGNHRGQTGLPTASNTNIGPNTTIAADAIQTGQGGQVSIWADDTTQYMGTTTVTGGELSGDGGFVEVSSKKTLFFDGIVDTRAPQGQTGLLLLDPENIHIINGELAPDDDQITDGTIFSPEGGALFTIAERTLARLSSSTNVTLEATNDITVGVLQDQTLAFAPTISSTHSGSITLIADADGNGVGDVVMTDPETTLIAPGRNLSISGANLRLGELNTAALFQAGDITLSASGSVTTGDIGTNAPQSNGQGGDIKITAADIITRNIITDSPAQAGNVTLIGQIGDITTGEISAASPNGASGTIDFTAPGSISVGGETVQGAPQAPMPPESMPESMPDLPPITPVSPEAAGESGGTALGNTAGLTLGALQTLGGPGTAGGSTAGGSGGESFGGLGGLGGGGADDDASGGAGSVVLSEAQANKAIAQLEGDRTQIFSDYFGQTLESAERNLAGIQQLLTDVENESGNKSAFVYVKAPALLSNGTESPLEILLLTSSSAAVKITVPNVKSTELLKTVSTFRDDLLTSVRRGGTPYLSSAQQLHQWLIEPVEAALRNDPGVDTLAFAMDTGLRTIPIAALHDGEQFLVEKYSVGVLPSLGLVDPHYTSLQSAQVMAMGASKFEQLDPLPAAELELERIDQLWPSATFLNERFTRHNLIQQRAQTPYNIVHLATHADFNSGSIDNSYIQLWDEKLPLSELKQLGWNNPAVDLLVLSACRTAVGSPEAELGFAGLALASGVRSAVASLWSVDDVGTLALMSEFYQQLGAMPTKVEALRAAQLAMLNGELNHEENGEENFASEQLLNGAVNEGSENALTHSFEPGTLKDTDFSHPYYWSGFSMIGSPW